MKITGNVQQKILQWAYRLIHRAWDVSEHSGWDYFWKNQHLMEYSQDGRAPCKRHTDRLQLNRYWLCFFRKSIPNSRLRWNSHVIQSFVYSSIIQSSLMTHSKWGSIFCFKYTSICLPGPSLVVNTNRNKNT